MGMLAPLILGLAASCAPRLASSEDPGTVTFRFESSGYTALTYWRRMKPEGGIGPQASVGTTMLRTLADAPPQEYAPITLTLDSGRYYLESFQAVTPLGYYDSADEPGSAGKGWDGAAGEPLYLAFTLAKGQRLILPKVSIAAEGDKKNPRLRFVFDDPEGIFYVGRKFRQ